MAIYRSRGALAQVGGRATKFTLAARAAWYRRRAKKVFSSRPDPILLCVGSGAAPLPGWINIDLRRPADVILDVRFGIPLDDAQVDFIYSEHLIEHLSLEDGMRFFEECRRVLKEHGVARFAAPDLAEIVTDYSTNWQRHDWVKWPEHVWIDSGPRMVNVAMRAWGHRYLYDYEELAMRLHDSGFHHVVREALGRSRYLALQNVETRADSTLIVEAYPNTDITHSSVEPAVRIQP
jgi:predicted SAM-dependent methyltransferase